MLVLLPIALPSFEGVRQRAAFGASAEQLLSFWNQARLEAAKRNQMVKVGVVQSDSGDEFLPRRSDDHRCRRDSDALRLHQRNGLRCRSYYPGRRQSEWRARPLPV